MWHGNVYKALQVVQSIEMDLDESPLARLVTPPLTAETTPLAVLSHPPLTEDQLPLAMLPNVPAP
ncbi:MAG TPA: hypothetical protein VHH53_10345, partial [Pseudonocardiaceae bacterium]|nr:hypothetical protein [Pseudonocardiaceae bacterium]